MSIDYDKLVFLCVICTAVFSWVAMYNVFVNGEKLDRANRRLLALLKERGIEDPAKEAQKEGELI